jgi:tetratricopeptide (TPR) repeat protein
LLVASAEDAGRLDTILTAARLVGADDGALDVAQRAGLVTTAHGRVDFYHPLLRASIYQAATAGERRRAHLALAQVLAAIGDVDRRAWHLATAAIGPDEDVARALEESAQRAQARGGYEAARAALERAAQLSVDVRASSRRLVSAAQNAWLAGEFSRATDLLQRVDPGSVPARLRTDIGQLRGYLEASAGTLTAAVRFLLQAAKDAETFDRRRARRILRRALRLRG